MKMEVEEHDVTGNITTLRVALNYTPVYSTEVAVDPIGGPAQVYGTDFFVDGKYLSWDLPTSTIKEVIAGGYNVVLRVIYERATI